MRIPIRALILASACCVVAPAMHAQKQDCTPPPADSKLTPEQQKAAAAGYKIACESVKAFNKRTAEESKQAAQLDEYIPDLYFPRMPANATLKDYMKWLRDESGSCPNLVEQARAGLAAYTTDEGKVAFLKTIQTLVTNKRGCE